MKTKEKKIMHGFVEKAGAQKDKVDMSNAWHQYDVNEWKSEKCFRSFAMFRVYHHCGLLSSLLYRFSLLWNSEKENYSLLMGYLLLCTQHTQSIQQTHTYMCWYASTIIEELPDVCSLVFVACLMQFMSSLIVLFLIYCFVAFIKSLEIYAENRRWNLLKSMISTIFFFFYSYFHSLPSFTISILSLGVAFVE